MLFPEEIRKNIQALMAFDKAPSRALMIRRAKSIVDLIYKGLEDWSQTETYPYSDCWENYSWPVIIDGAPPFFQRRLEDALLVGILEPIYVVSAQELSWLYDDESEWSKRRNSLLE